MATLQDILADKKTYPDEQTLQLADGSTATLGELRSGFLRQADYTNKTTALARERDEWTRQANEKAQALQTAEQKLMELAKQVVGPREQPTKDDVADLVQNDPVAGRLMAEITQLKNVLGQVTGHLKKKEEQEQQSVAASFEAQHRAVIAQIQKFDPDVNVEELVDFARRNYTPRLDIAYAAMTREKAISKAKQDALEEGQKKGYDKAKIELSVPQIPLRRPGIPDQNAPKNLDEAMERALGDPEVINPLFGVAS